MRSHLRANVWIICPLAEHFARVASLRALVDRLSSEMGVDTTVFVAVEGAAKPGKNEGLATRKDVQLVGLPTRGGKGWGRLVDAARDWIGVIRREQRRRPPTLVVAVDKWGLFLSALVTPVSREVWYLNLELRVPSEIRRWSRRIAVHLEQRLHRRCTLTIIQDRWRSDFIREDHKLSDRHPILLLPNSPGGSGKCIESSYLRTKFEIPADLLVALYVGSLGDHFLIHEMIDAFGATTGVALIIHSPPTNGDGQFRSGVRERIGQVSNVILSEEFLDPCALDKMICSADVGVGFFKPTPGNVINKILMGYSSGKLSMYLQRGIPILTSEFPSMSWVSERKCGERLREVSSMTLRQAIWRLRQSPEEYKANALQTFDDVLELSPYLDRILERIRASA